MKKNVILFVNSVSSKALAGLLEYTKSSGQKLEFALIRDTKKKKPVGKKLKGLKYVIDADFKKPLVVAKALHPYQDRLLAITCRGESNLDMFAKLIPQVPYLRTPTVESLHWATNKIAMRQRLHMYDSKMVPRFMIVHDASEESVEKISKKIRFPLILKPAGLASSLLVSVCYHKEELQSSLRKISRKIHKLYRDSGRKVKPQILAEQLMEGTMYSIDGVVSSRGNCHWLPLVKVKTGREIGFDDFFGYMRITPVQIGADAVKAAEKVSTDAVHALGLRSTSLHVELMRTESGWKIIEVGARMGGFRHLMYRLSYGIDYNLNDVLIRIPKKPIISKRRKGFTAVLKIYAPTEGILKQVKGLRKMKSLESYVSVIQYLKEGERALFAKHGGKGVCDVTLFNKDRSHLLADIRRVEQGLKVQAV